MYSFLINICWLIFQMYVGVTLAFPLISYVIYRVRKKSEKKYKKIETKNDYAVIVTAYKNFSNLDHVINSLLKSSYDNYIIYVVADDCSDFQDHFNNKKVVILKPLQILANQVKSHFYAISNFKRNHNILTIIDSD